MLCFFDDGLYGIKGDKISKIQGNYNDYDLIFSKNYLPEELPEKMILILDNPEVSLIEEINMRKNEFKDRSLLILNDTTYSTEFLKEILDKIKGIWVQDSIGEKIVYGYGDYMHLWRFDINSLLRALELKIKERYLLLKKKEILYYNFTRIFTAYKVVRELLKNEIKEFEIFLVPTYLIQGERIGYVINSLAKALHLTIQTLRSADPKVFSIGNNIYVHFVESKIMLKFKGENPRQYFIF